MTMDLADLADLAEAQYRAAQVGLARRMQGVEKLRKQVDDLRKERAAWMARNADPRRLQVWMAWWDQEMARLNTALAASLADIEPARARVQHLQGRCDAIGALVHAGAAEKSKARHKRRARAMLEQVLLGSRAQTS